LRWLGQAGLLISTVSEQQEKHHDCDQRTEYKGPWRASSFTEPKLLLPSAGFRLPFALLDLQFGLFVDEGMIEHGISSPFKVTDQPSNQTVQNATGVATARVKSNLRADFVLL
jgi:hypothetical protein